ncbi:MAG: hypothetical protein LBP64_07345 [Tannerella sp.]|jgi:hypothetical protein|nr:hypothetical protein [Tannerella sp.]
MGGGKMIFSPTLGGEAGFNPDIQAFRGGGCGGLNTAGLKIHKTIIIHVMQVHILFSSREGMLFLIVRNMSNKDEESKNSGKKCRKSPQR